MISLRRISILFSYFLVSGIIFLTSDAIVFSQIIIAADSIKPQQVFPLPTDRNKISHHEPSVNFYKTDSIFSFRSPKGYVPSLLHNIGETAAAPCHFKTKEWLITGSVVVVTASLIMVDDDIDHWAGKLKDNYAWINKSSPVITQGGGNFGVYTILATGLASAALKNEKGLQTSLLASQAMITSGIIGYLIKMVTGRERPRGAYIYSQKSGGKWNGPFGRYRDNLPYKRSAFAFDAFPSGHTSTAFSIATVFASQYNDTRVFPVFCYSAATAVGLSRLTEHEHWASDVFFGAVLGYLSGKQVIRHFNRTVQNTTGNIRSESEYKSELTFIQNDNQIGVLVKW